MFDRFALFVLRFAVRVVPLLGIALGVAAGAERERRVLDERLHHLRSDGPREWSDFPETPESDRLVLRFDA